MILLLAHNNLQERTLQIILKLGGHHAHLVRDELEAINMIKNVPRKIRGIVFGTAGCQSNLTQCIQTFREHQINTPIYLVALLGHEEIVTSAITATHHDLNLSVYNNQQLLRHLNQPA
ncbi:MAG: hypothetical protein C0624_07945 [Desulfuromonas sp.]|nr:MAG: hypothetical protein C0624_07945 [Desulfuromonas sp.]